MSDDRADLESRLAFQEDAINELNITVARQQNEIETLKRALQTLNQRVKAMAPSEESSPSHEIPPHY